MTNSLYSITISGQTYDVTPFGSDPEVHLHYLNSEKITELKSDYRKHCCSVVANRVAAVSLGVLGFPFAVAGSLITDLLFVPALCFVDLRKARAFATFPVSLLLDITCDIWYKNGLDHHNYSIPQVRRDALEALRSPNVHFDKDDTTGYCYRTIKQSSEKIKYEFYDFKKLQKLGLITEQDIEILKSLKNVKYIKDLRKKEQFILQKFPFYVDWSSGSKKNVYLTKNELDAIEDTDLALHVDTIKEAAGINTADGPTTDDLMHVQKEHCNYVISSSRKEHFLRKYFTLAAINKICQKQKLGCIKIPPVKFIDMKVKGEIYTILAQKGSSECSLLAHHQEEAHQLNIQAISQLLQVVSHIKSDLYEKNLAIKDKNLVLLSNP